MVTSPDTRMLKDVNRELIDAIVAMTSLDANQIESLDIEEIEEKLNIKTITPKIYFGWEKGEKTGWQFSSYKHISKKDIDRREKMLDIIIMKHSGTNAG